MTMEEKVKKTIKKSVVKKEKTIVSKVAEKKAEPIKKNIVEKKEVSSKAINIGESPYKLRLVVNLIRGKMADKAQAELSFLNKKGALIVKKLLDSCIANARSRYGLEAKDLKVSEIFVNEATSYKRFRIASRSRVASLKKRRSHIILKLVEK